MKDLTELLATARRYADLTGHGALFLAPDVTTAEAHVAAWHAITVQGGYSSPQREAWRLAADRGTAAPGSEHLAQAETPVDAALVHKAIGDAEFFAGNLSGTANQDPATAEPPTVGQRNERGEFSDQNGSIAHQIGEPGQLDFAIHAGEWLKCEQCNPLQVLRAQPGTELADLRARYAELKAAKDKATEEFDAVKTKLQAQLSEATEGATRSALYVDGFKPMNLTYSEPWTVDSKRLQAEQPLIYVQYAKQGKRWTLAESRGQ